MEFPVGTEEEDHPVAMDESALRETFRRDGIVVLDGVLAGSALESFREQVSRELTKPCIPPESGTPEGVRLSSPETWPRGSQRRGVGHWQSLEIACALPLRTGTSVVHLGPGCGGSPWPRLKQAWRHLV